MKRYPLLLAAVLLLGACKKHSNSGNGSGGSTSGHSYFKDNVINENVKGSQTFQHALGYFSLGSDPATQIMVASRGTTELSDAAGFRIAGINTANGNVNWIKSYELPDQYFIQIATCAAMDKSENIWVGGHCFQGSGFSTLFLVKLDNKGNLLWSKTFANYLGWRAYAIEALSNGDMAFFTKTQAGMTLHRLTPDGQSRWATQAICKGSLSIDNDYYTKPNLLSPENHGLVEAGDGSLFMAASGNGPINGVGGTDHLVRLDANGNLLYSKTYTLDNNNGLVRPVQLLAFGNSQVLMTDQAFGNTPSPSPFFTLLSLDGGVQVSRGAPLNSTGPDALNINEVNNFQGNIYFSTCGGYQFNTYVLDAGLNLRSSVKTAAALDIGTDRGGIALFDAAHDSLYYVLNFGGNYGESNGFEVLRNDASGKPCVNTYTDPPQLLSLEKKSITVAADTTFGFITGPAATFAPLTWNSAPVTVTVAENVCGL